jgi:hypothetical protein
LAYYDSERSFHGFKKPFDVVKHVKASSRAAVKAPKAQVVRSKKKELL